MEARKFRCEICGRVHDEALAGRWEELPEDWACPECGATKADFTAEEPCASS